VAKRSAERKDQKQAEQWNRSADAYMAEVELARDQESILGCGTPNNDAEFGIEMARMTGAGEAEQQGSAWNAP